MYDRHFGLSAMPFQLTPDGRFYFGSRGHSRAFAHLTYGLSQGEGFVVITGEVGAGKTTLLERLYATLDRATYTLARVTTTQLSGDDLFRLAMAGFGLQPQDVDKATLLQRFSELLRAHAMDGRRCLLLVDEAQNLSLAGLEELRMLSNLTDEGRVGLQTVLLGQPQFRRMLHSEDLDQLRQRVVTSYHLGPLGADETRAYVEHRLRTAGWNGNPRWDEPALDAVFTASGGVPRRINRLCSRVMVAAALDDMPTITPALVETTAEELRQDIGDDVGSPTEPSGTDRRSDGPAGPSVALRQLARRVEQLEIQMAENERLLRRIGAALAPRVRSDQ